MHNLISQLKQLLTCSCTDLLMFFSINNTYTHTNIYVIYLKHRIILNTLLCHLHLKFSPGQQVIFNNMILMTIQCSLLWIYSNLFNQSPITRHLNCFQLFYIRNHVEGNILANIFMYFCYSFLYNDFLGVIFCSFLNEICTLWLFLQFYSILQKQNLNIIYSHKLNMRVSIPLHSFQHQIV